MNDRASIGLLAHSVTASAGTVMATDLDEAVPCVRLVFHHGVDDAWDRLGRDVPVHSERFFAPEGLRPLIAQLSSLADQLGI